MKINGHTFRHSDFTDTICLSVCGNLSCMLNKYYADGTAQFKERFKDSCDYYTAPLEKYRLIPSQFGRSKG